MRNSFLQEEGATNSETCLMDVRATKRATLQERSSKKIYLIGSKGDFGGQRENQVEHRVLQ